MKRINSISKDYNYIQPSEYIVFSGVFRRLGLRFGIFPCCCVSGQVILTFPISNAILINYNKSYKNICPLHNSAFVFDKIDESLNERGKIFLFISRFTHGKEL